MSVQQPTQSISFGQNNVGWGVGITFVAGVGRGVGSGVGFGVGSGVGFGVGSGVSIGRSDWRGMVGPGVGGGVGLHVAAHCARPKSVRAVRLSQHSKHWSVEGALGQHGNLQISTSGCPGPPLPDRRLT